MFDVKNASPPQKQLLRYLDEFEQCCTGEKYCSPSKFREINKHLSIGAVLRLGTHRYETNLTGTRLFWKGLDGREYDMGLTHDMHVMRDYPGFHAQCSRSLGNDLVLENKTIPGPNKKGSLSVVTMKDGSTGIGPNYRIALRNAVLKMHLTAQFNRFSLAGLWKQIWGRA